MVPVFDKYLARKEEDFSDRNLQDYDSSKKEKFFCKNLTLGVPTIAQRCGRNPATRNSMHDKTVGCGDNLD